MRYLNSSGFEERKLPQSKTTLPSKFQIPGVGVDCFYLALLRCSFNAGGGGHPPPEKGGRPPYQRIGVKCSGVGFRWCLFRESVRLFRQLDHILIGAPF